MAADFIKIDRTNTAATEAGLLLQYIGVLRNAYELGVRVRAKMRHNFDDSDPQNINWSALEALFGVPTSKGATVFTFIDGSIGAMEGAFKTSAAKDITENVG